MEKVENQKLNLKKSVILNNGIEMPLMGLGTYKLEDIKNSIKTAVKCGYRLFDTASLYDNELEVGLALNECIQEGLIKREEIFLVTKLWNDDHENPEGALKKSLQLLNMDYVDLYLIHWPMGEVKEGKLIKQVPLLKTWAKLEECVNKGLTKSIGVSNFNVQLLLDLLSYANIKPVVNQVELHPYLTQEDLVDFCHRFEIRVAAYNPILRGSYFMRKVDLFNKYDLFKNTVIIELSKKYNKEPAQIILNWHLKREICAIPKSSNPTRQLQNLNSSEFLMEEEDYKKISDLNLDMRFNVAKEKAFSAGINIFA
jgi:alcohol dehydrogenase (NADP+)